jgi:hypothetical protein
MMLHNAVGTFYRRIFFYRSSITAFPSPFRPLTRLSVLETTVEKVGFLSGCLKRYASSRSSPHEHKRHSMSFTPPRTYPTP